MLILGVLALRLAAPAVALGVTSCQKYVSPPIPMLHHSDTTEVSNTTRSKLTRKAVHYRASETITSAHLLFSSRALTLHLHQIRAPVHLRHYRSLNNRLLERSQPVMRYGIVLGPKDVRLGGKVSRFSLAIQDTLYSHDLVQAPDHEAGALYVPIRDSAKSSFESTPDLYKWFWYAFPSEKLRESFHDLYSTWGIGWALQDLDISDVRNPGGSSWILTITSTPLRTRVGGTTS
jgi:hypothetical protein